MHSGLKVNRSRGLAAVLAVSAGLCIVGPAAPACGQVSAFEYWGSRLGSNQTVTVNGLRVTRLPTGSVSVVRVSDGQRVIYSSEGISRFDMTDGRTLFRYPDGKQAIFSPNGTRQVFWPGGARSIYRADGREEHLLTDGRYIVRPTTGPITQTETWPNGTRIYTYGEGTKVTFFPNGTKRTELSNGTVITSSWGNTSGSSGGGSGGGGGQPAPTIPAAPGGLVVTANPGGGFAMSWADNSDNEQKFVIERQPPFLSGTREVGANVIDYVDQTNLQTAQYRVAAANAAGTSEFTGWASVGNPSSDFPILQPGGGFAGPTAQPQAVGNPQMPGYDAKAIARWDVVPYQTFDGDLHIGVVAFHMNGIDRVEFSVDGGPWTPVYEMKLNPHSDVWEYTATLRASLFADGPVEVRAIAWPAGAGEARVLGGEITPESTLLGEHAMLLAANAGGSIGGTPRWVDPDNGDDNASGLTSADPMRTLNTAVRAIQQEQGSLDGARVYLMEGDHDWMCFTGNPGNNSFASITFEAAPGAREGFVRMASRPEFNLNAPRIRYVDLRGLTITQNIKDTTHAASGLNRLWADECLFDAGSLTTSFPGWNAAEWEIGVYVTNSRFETGRVGLNGVRLARGTRMQNIGEDAFKNVPCILSASVALIEKGDASYHPDLVQYLGEWDNTLVYGLEARDVRAQTIFSRSGTQRHDNAAFVNVYIDQSPLAYYGQWIRSSNHVLFWHWTSIGRPFWFRNANPGTNEPLEVTNLSVRNSVFTTISYPADRYPAPDAAFSNNHFIAGAVLGRLGTGGQLAGTAGVSLINGRVTSEHWLVGSDALGACLVLPAALGAVQGSTGSIASP